MFYRPADGAIVPSFLVTKSVNSASINTLTAILPERHAELRYLRSKYTRDISQVDRGGLGDHWIPKKVKCEGWGLGRLFRHAILAWLAHKTSILYHKCRGNELIMN